MMVADIEGMRASLGRVGHWTVLALSSIAEFARTGG
jgi:hypothetical protein